ncbi:nucleotidyltransferase family protein [Nordella sp. HKS 07]|uniref:nucleotidyltransferase family protein n=1 Tax=Nordella sp. HKS 07 TaxID=2712222 RepID=UPI0013E1CCEF|nr:nucleotidyltransferase family protein [Nordella sp. HKS 07]QIG49667.1 nucleotidyltransferase family protein [Nordella sp. HKS 07]
MHDSDLGQRLEAILRLAPLRLTSLEIVRSLALPDWAIGAGFIRAAVWDELSGFTAATAVDDIDVLYFDPENRDSEHDAALEKRLREIEPALPWSVRNQARMHVRNGDAPYGSTADALRFWLDTPTCVAVRLDAQDRLEILAPYGLEDLFSMSIRPTPRGRTRKSTYTARIAEKKWHQRWPNVTVELP